MCSNDASRPRSRRRRHSRPRCALTRRAVAAADVAAAEGLAAWLSGQPNVAAAVRRSAGVRGELDHFGAFGFLQGLLTVLRDSGHPGLLVVLDEVETLQRVRSDVREKALNALRQLIDEVDSGRFPGLNLLITGTPAYFEGTQGVQRLAPLAGRLATDFTTDARFDNPRAIQIRLPGFSLDSLSEVARPGSVTSPASGADLLDPALVHHIINTLGWPALRPLQSDAVAPTLRGDDLLMVAPTAGGMTEAAVFPLLAAMIAQRWTGLSVLYVCPLRALLNNLEPRLEQYAGWLGRRAALWHGDTGDGARRRLLLDPPDIC